MCDLNDLLPGIYRHVVVFLKSALIYFDFRGREIEGDRVLSGGKKVGEQIGKVNGTGNSKLSRHDLSGGKQASLLLAYEIK